MPIDSSARSLTRADFLKTLAAGLAWPAVYSCFAEEVKPARGIGPLVASFVDETRPEGGVENSRSRWMKTGKGSAVGGKTFDADNDPRYLRFLVEALYRLADLDRSKLAVKEALQGLPASELLIKTADAHVRYMAKTIKGSQPTWALGNALEILGLHHRFRKDAAPYLDDAKRIVKLLRDRKVSVTTRDGVTFGHFPCGYGVLKAKDAGWTNDLSMVGSGLVHAYELLGDNSILSDAVSFAEYFVQPWRPNALGKNGYWECGTWHEKLGSWVIGPSHFSGFESTTAYGDEASWVFSTATCCDYLMMLQKHQPDARYLDRCARAAEWTFRECQFDDGQIGMCGRDDKWFGMTGHGITQVSLLEPYAHHTSLKPLAAGLLEVPALWSKLDTGRRRAWQALQATLPMANLDDHGVIWVNRKTSTDPLVNVAMLWGAALRGWLNGLEVS